MNIVAGPMHIINSTSYSTTAIASLVLTVPAGYIAEILSLESSNGELISYSMLNEVITEETKKIYFIKFTYSTEMGPYFIVNYSSYYI
jgi:hypothetical protein